MWRKPILFLLILLAGCQQTAVLPTEPLPTTQPTNEPTATVAPTPPPTPQLPASALFRTAWDDRTPFAAGLRPSEQPILDELSGATIYHLDLILEEGFTAVLGQQQLRYTNQETVPLTELYFHLHPNVLGGTLTVDNVRLNNQPATATTESDNSLLRISLPAPLQPAEQIIIQLDFHTTIPQELGRNYGVFAHVDEILALAHFYPMLAVYDDEGWNIAQPAEGGDVTYGDTSFFMVRITAPANQIIATSGITLEQQTADGQQTLTVAAGPMRDFYLATSENFERLSQEVDGITINSFAPANAANGSRLALETAVSAVAGFNGRFAPYPYTELDIVTTPTLALGVEYPGIIANTLRMYDDGNGQPNRNFLESTTVHEVAHQWFYGLVGNDQLDEPWLDESLTQYATWLYYVDQYGEQGGNGFFRALESRWSSTGQAEIPIGLPVADYSDNEYSSIVYGRGPIFVRELAEQVGEETFARFLQQYQQQFRWGIAKTADFQTLLEQTCSCDLSEAFAKNIYGE